MKKDSRRSFGVSRRGFLKALVVAGAGALVPSVGLAGAGADAVPSGEELVTLLDLSKCIGCGACVEACREANAPKFPEPEKPFPAMSPASRAKPEDWSGRRDVDDRLTPYNWLSIQTAQVRYQGVDHVINIPRRCMHCVNPPCANMCPFGAANKQANGLTRINDSLCLGGAKCRTVCPWHIPQRQSGVGLYLDLMPRFAGNGVMYKCDRCYQRIDQGELPACIVECPEGVQTIGPRREMIARARTLADEMNGFIYGLTENGGTNTLYVSPVPFDLLDAAVEQGKGRPHLKPVADVMADETNLATATLLAPVAGIAAGFLGLGARLLGRDKPGLRDEESHEEKRESDKGESDAS
ncbi:MAG: 4Fe-4S dicluster domain-containing protein [Pseudodesulfovibrio sp.]|uniref:4Fe-4S ferredoxin iron-sulfur binding domain protein n=1 Tax=Pseudodesulfovibrio aespoeensis (strain ATCC 700646 / DSM 10631 / Aspo-2) TaxID=643562 RepID=E6VT09_PSEA9|nr:MULTISPECIES: 4Fe-4S dicluster domain-containing protein [Pseudodesulfovibrio]MBU4191964.1 4Fe-4S dicluster domain-containing protein [Pseudomonadota bacterium]ADU62059.1 4Fe-4S ferredoxin iron-sulfur binding domain protein [Pseudodesulfovibrio aespoeensis Aspo-2]MBU4243709.1 4Fe-4S dicluster domain-containing protein [Pseudomonadota bacterium]MBU4474702.1 4Fe-4S dicluster domain-containing protein [Pseudomonadota bacterium]MBU4515971.1 4Fe-4S dicluster domain-containing protein [Pseudomona